MPLPDPVLSANLYASGRLEAALFRVVAPVWREVRGRTEGEDRGRGSYLWLMRYARGGEHLKLRLHGTEAVARALRLRLEEKAQTFFAALAEAGAGGSGGEEVARFSRPDAPPLDVEDEAAAGYPDCSLLWTKYRRRALCLGGPPWLGDDVYAGLLTRCLAGATELLLEADVSGEELPHRLRQSTLLKGLILGLEGLGWSREERCAYLAYHRDWLLRYPVLKGAAEEATLIAALRRFDELAERAKAYVETLRGVLEDEWSAAAQQSEESPVHDDWKSSLADLAGYVRGFREDPERDLDPYAADPLFVPVFKVMHGLANQVGLSHLDEAFAHHLLLRAARPDGTGESIRLLPESGAGLVAAGGDPPRSAPAEGLSP